VARTRCAPLPLFGRDRSPRTRKARVAWVDRTLTLWGTRVRPRIRRRALHTLPRPPSGGVGAEGGVARGPGSAIAAYFMWRTLPLGGAFHSRRLRLISSQVGKIAPSHRSSWTHRPGSSPRTGLDQAGHYQSESLRGRPMTHAKNSDATDQWQSITVIWRSRF
jgi:hypothetical protein